MAIESVHSTPCHGASEAPGGQDCRLRGIREHHHSGCVDILFPQQAEWAPEHNHKAAAKALAIHLAIAFETAVQAELAASTAMQSVPSHPLERLSARTLRSTILVI